jgi:recombination protein RecA
VSAFEEFIARLDPKTAARIKTAEQIDLIKLPLASRTMTNALGGGIGAGRLTLLYGAAQAGKSVLCMQSVGLWQKAGKVCAWIDVEGTYDKAWAARLGINNEELILVSNKKSSGAVEKEVLDLIRAGIDVVVIDSISDIVPEVFVDGDGDINPVENRKQMAQHAKAITALAQAIGYVNEKTAVVMISQVTTKMEATYVKLVPHGGRKMEHMPSQIIRLSSSNTDAKQIKGQIQVGNRLVEQPIGRSVGFVIEKNKMGRPFMSGSYDLYYAGDRVGIDSSGEILDMAESFGVVTKTGSWMYFGEEKFHGRPAFVEALNADEKLLLSVTNAINEVLTGEVV